MPTPYPQTNDGFPGYGSFGLGVSTFPLIATGANSLLQDADPVLYYLLDFAYNVLQLHAQARWAVEVARPTLNFAAPFPNVCASRVPYNPFPFLQDTGLNLPLLAAYWVDGKSFELTRDYLRTESTIEIAYVLPPMTAAQTEILGPILHAVRAILTDRFETGFDPNYLDGYQLGALTQYDNLWVRDYKYGLMPHTTTNLPMQSVILTIVLRERNMAVADQFQPVSGYDVQSYVNPTGGMVPTGPMGLYTGPAFNSNIPTFAPGP